MVSPLPLTRLEPVGAVEDLLSTPLRPGGASLEGIGDHHRAQLIRIQPIELRADLHQRAALDSTAIGLHRQQRRWGRAPDGAIPSAPATRA